MRMKIALAGIGKIARDQHVPAIAASPDWELAATVSRHGRIDGVEAFFTIEAMLEARPDIGIVSLCMPPAPRYEYAAKAIRAGRHVMLEKPPGATLTECRELEAMARSAGVSLFATWHSREAAQVKTAREWLQGKRIERVHVSWKEDIRRWHPGQTWITQPGGLGVFDPGINALSILTAILPDAIHLTSAELAVPENWQTPIAASLFFAHPHGANVAAEFDFRQQGDETWSIEAETDGGRMLLSQGGARLEIDGRRLPDPAESPSGEYPRLYSRMAGLVAARGMDMDLAPMVHVADAFLIGKRRAVEAFEV